MWLPVPFGMFYYSINCSYYCRGSKQLRIYSAKEFPLSTSVINIPNIGIFITDIFITDAI